MYSYLESLKLYKMKGRPGFISAFSLGVQGLMKSKARSINWANQKYEHMKGHGTGTSEVEETVGTKKAELSSSPLSDRDQTPNRYIAFYS